MRLIVVSHNQDGPGGGSRPYPKEWKRRLQLPEGQCDPTMMSYFAISRKA
jgi:hypothetical protein